MNVSGQIMVDQEPEESAMLRSNWIVSLDDHIDELDNRDTLKEHNDMPHQNLNHGEHSNTPEKLTGTIGSKSNSSRRKRRATQHFSAYTNSIWLKRVDPPYRPPHRLSKMKFQQRNYIDRICLKPVTFGNLVRSDIEISGTMMKVICLCKKVKRSCITRFLMLEYRKNKYSKKVPGVKKNYRKSQQSVLSKKNTRNGGTYQKIFAAEEQQKAQVLRGTMMGKVTRSRMWRLPVSS